MSKKIVINNCWGCFSLSRKAFLRLRELGNEVALEEADYGECWSDNSGPREDHGGAGHFCSDISRDDPLLLKVLKELGKEANGQLSSLKIVSIPDNVTWIIDDYDGMESVAEEHRTWM